MAWLYLLIAGTCEVAATTMYRYTDGLSRAVPTLMLFVFAIASLYFLNRSLSGIPIGTAYAVWTGIGAVGVALLGIVLFGESAAAARLACIGLIVAGIVGLKLVTPA